MDELNLMKRPIYIVGKGWQCDEMPPVGTELYLHNEPNSLLLKMYKALKHAAPYVFKFGDAKGKADYSLIVDAIGEYEKIKG